MNRRFDAIIIGAGQAGPPMAGRLTAAGLRVAVVERNLFGGTCVNTGCKPTKTLVASAYAAQLARRAAEYGVLLNGDVEIDAKAVALRQQSVSARSRADVEAQLRGMNGCTVFTEHARFRSAHVVAVGDEALEADRIFINVGGRAHVPVMPGLDAVAYLTNSSLLQLDTIPEHLVVVGGSYIGLEFAQIYRRFGSTVTIVEKGPRLIGHEDTDVSDAVAGILRDEGIALRLDAECIRFAAHVDGVAVGVDCTVGAPEVVGGNRGLYVTCGCD